MVKRIGIVANTAFNIYNFRLGLMRYLAEQGYDVFAIAPADDYVSRITDAGFRFVELKHLARKGTNPLKDLQLAYELRSIYQREKPDAVLQYTIKPNIYGTLAARTCGVRTVCTVTGLGYTFLNASLAATVAHRLYRLAFGWADNVLFQNTDDRDVFVSGNLVDAAKTAIVPGSGIDINHFNPGQCPPREADGITRFLMIGRFLKDKGIYEYSEAARLLKAQQKAVEFHLVGEVDEHNPSSITREALQRWIDEGLIRYDGYLRDTRPAICAADCIVLPSYREGMPRVILEGMAMGKPCITTDVPGCKDAVDASCGFLAKGQDVKSLAEQMQRFVDRNQNERQAMGIAARMRAKNIYADNIIFRHYLDILQKF